MKECFELVNCRLYASLPCEDALKVGYEHNLCNSLGMPTTTEDLLLLFRREWLLRTDESADKIEPKTIRSWHTSLSYILCLDVEKRDLHNKYKTLLALAKAGPQVWELVTKLIFLWNKGKLLKRPKGILKTVHLSKMAGLKTEKVIEVLTNLVTVKNWQEFCSLCASIKGQTNKKQKKGDEHLSREHAEEIKTDQHNSENSEQEEEDKLANVCRNLKKEIRQKESECCSLRSSIVLNEKGFQKMKKELQHFKDMTSSQTLKISTLEETQALLQKENEDLKDSVAHYIYQIGLHTEASTSNSVQEVNTDEFLVEENNTERDQKQESSAKKRKTETEENVERTIIALVEYTNKQLYLGAIDGKHIMYAKRPVGRIGSPLRYFQGAQQLNTRDIQILDLNYIIVKFEGIITGTCIQLEQMQKDKITQALTKYNIPIQDQ